MKAHGCEAEQALDETGRDVDELHASVGDHRKPLDHHSAPNKKVVVPLQVAPRGATTVHESLGEQSNNDDSADDGRSECKSKGHCGRDGTYHGEAECSESHF